MASSRVPLHERKEIAQTTVYCDKKIVLNLNDALKQIYKCVYIVEAFAARRTIFVLLPASLSLSPARSLVRTNTLFIDVTLTI